MAPFSLTAPAARKIPRAFFKAAAKKILGDSYHLEVTFITSTAIQKLNSAYRLKKTSTDILAFPLSQKSGELYLSLSDVRKKALLFAVTPDHYLKFLFIHGLLHLKGCEHGRTMEMLERKYCRAFSIPHVG